MTQLTSASKIRSVTFPPARDGYDLGVVDQFVTDVADLVAAKEQAIAEKDQTINDLRQEQAQEQTAAQASQAPVVDQAVSLLRHAQTTAEQVIDEAQSEATTTLSEARTLAEELLEEARRSAATIVADATAEVHQLEERVRELEIGRANLSASLLAAAEAAAALTRAEDSPKQSD